VRVPVNQGYGLGILSGLRAATGEIIGWTHADLQTDVMDVLTGGKKPQTQEPASGTAAPAAQKKPSIGDLLGGDLGKILGGKKQPEPTPEPAPAPTPEPAPAPVTPSVATAAVPAPAPAPQPAPASATVSPQKQIKKELKTLEKDLKKLFKFK